MRVSTKAKPYATLDNARRYAEGEDFNKSITIESKVDRSGLLIFGPSKEDDFKHRPTRLEIDWSGEDRILRMKYMIIGEAKGLLLSAFDDTYLPEIRFVCDKDKGLGGFEFTADDNGSSYLFGRFSQAKGSSEIFEESWMPGMKTLHATRMTNFHINKLIGDVLEPIKPFVQDS